MTRRYLDDIGEAVGSLSFAVRYAEREWSTIPVTEGEKTPAVEWKRYTEERADRAQLDRWFSNGSRYGVGIVTGTISGLVVLDTDGTDAESFVKSLGLPDTKMVRTANGFHRYFRLPIGTVVKNSAGLIYPGVDVRGEGGFVVAPPSVHPDGPIYEWMPGTTLAVWPAEKIPMRSRDRDGEAVGRIPDVIGVARNNTLTSLAGSIYRRGMSEREMFDMLQVPNLSRCLPPLEEAEVRKIARSAVSSDWDAPGLVVPGAERFGAVSWTEAQRRIDANPVVWRIDDVLATDEYGVLAGPKGVGKTFGELDMAVATAFGERWLTRFPTTRCRVLVFTAEDSETRIWRRIDAIARSMGHEPSELEGWLFVHPLPFSVIDDLGRLRAEIAAVQPGLVIVDPAYKYLAGVNSSQIFEMGKPLTNLQVACIERGAALIVGHHYNRKTGAEREERISGAGLFEWARVVITMEALPRRAGDGPRVEVTFEISGNSIEPQMLTLGRTVIRLEEGPASPLRYEVEVHAEGLEAAREKHMTGPERILGVLKYASPLRGRTVREIGDELRALGHPMKANTIRQNLKRLKDEGQQATSIEVRGEETRWF